MKVKILSTELDFDFYEYESAKRFETALARVDETEIEKLFRGGSLAEGIKAYCQTVNQLFEDIFGAGMVQTLFGSVYDFRRSSQALADLRAARDAVQTDTETQLANMLSKYNPNRAARRSKKR